MNSIACLAISVAVILLPNKFVFAKEVDVDGIIKRFNEDFKRFEDPKQRDQARLWISLESMLSGLAPEGTPAQAKAIVQLIEKASDLNISCASYSLGELYHDGYSRDEYDSTKHEMKTVEIVPKDREKAFSLYEKSAKGGCPDGQRILGLAYSNGDGVLENDRESFHWYEKAALNGQPESQINVALAYYAGKGIKEDKIKSLAWLILGETQLDRMQNPKLKESLPPLKEKLKGSLPQSSVQKAQDLALTLQKKIKINQNNFKG